jgi:toxin ParE1/3/4
MTPRFVFHPAARAELLEARAWYDGQRAGLGAELAHVIDESIGRIGEHPEAYPEVDPGVRRAVLPRFPYGLFYRIEPDAIRIIAFFHHRRDPRLRRT